MGNSKKQPENKGEKENETLASRAEKTIKEMAAILAAYPEPGQWTQEQRDQKEGTQELKIHKYLTRSSRRHGVSRMARGI